jgi:hypothetical protein
MTPESTWLGASATSIFSHTTKDYSEHSSILILASLATQQYHYMRFTDPVPQQSRIRSINIAQV